MIGSAGDLAQKVKDYLATSPGQREGLLEAGDFDSSPDVVTDIIPDFSDFRTWLEPRLPVEAVKEPKQPPPARCGLRNVPFDQITGCRIHIGFQ